MDFKRKHKWEATSSIYKSTCYCLRWKKWSTWAMLLHGITSFEKVQPLSNLKTKHASALPNDAHPLPTFSTHCRMTSEGSNPKQDPLGGWRTISLWNNLGKFARVNQEGTGRILSAFWRNGQTCSFHHSRLTARYSNSKPLKQPVDVGLSGGAYKFKIIGNPGPLLGFAKTTGVDTRALHGTSRLTEGSSMRVFWIPGTRLPFCSRDMLPVAVPFRYGKGSTWQCCRLVNISKRHRILHHVCSRMIQQISIGSRNISHKKWSKSGML